MKTTLKIEGIDCTVCAAKLEKQIRKIRGVMDAKYDFFTQILELEAEEADMPTVLSQLPKACRRVEPDCVIHMGEAI